MKLEISTNSLLEALKSVSLPAGNPTTMIPKVLITAPPLQGGQAGSVFVSATDPDLTLRSKVPARVDVAGRAAIPTRDLLCLVANLNTQSVIMWTDDKHNAHIAAGGSHYQFCDPDPTYYPAFATQTGQTFTTQQADLKGMFSRTLFCASTDRSRYIINSVLLDFSPSDRIQEGTTVTAVGTDGRRLAKVEGTVPGNLTGPGTTTGITVPRRAALKIRAALTASGQVTVQYDSTRATFEMARKSSMLSITTELLDGTYPNYKDVIPGKRPGVEGVPPYTPTTVTVNRRQLFRALQRVGRMSNQNYKSVTLDFSPAKLRMTSSGNAGSATEELGINFTGIPFDIKINPDFITSALKVLREDVVDLVVTNGTEPLVLQSTCPFLYVAMPMLR